VIISGHPDSSRGSAKTPPLVFTILLHLDWESFNEVLSEFFSTIIFESHAACSLAINIAGVSVLLY
jgi:hypothetical protein